MRTIATLNLPASTSGICRSAPAPDVPVPAQSAAPCDAPPLAAGPVEAEAGGAADAAVVGAVVAAGVEQAPAMMATVIQTVAHDSRRLIPRILLHGHATGT
jgi:hypothetical protein